MGQKSGFKRDLPRPEYLVPTSIFVGKLTPFEAVVTYLKDVKGLTYRDIAMVLGKDERNIWTVYNRARKK